MINIDKCLNEIKPHDYDLLIGFVHKDAAASFFVTFYHILQTKSIALIFEKNLDLLEEYVNIVSENTDAQIVAVKAYHNPTPLKIKFDKAIEEL